MKLENTHMRKQAGIALVTTLLLLVLMAAMVVGFMLLVSEGQRLSGMDSDQMRAFYGAESGMEKLTADLGTLFGTTYSPTGAQVNALMNNPPALPSSTGVSYVDAQGNNTYSITYPKDNNGNPLPAFAQITSGSSAFQGMSALETTYTLSVGALTNTGAQVKLQRSTQTVGIPLFQFGIFSQTDLSFFPGPNFNFGGRVHTNGNLFLDSGGPANALPTQTTTNQLWMASPVTASKDILRDCLTNGYPESTSSIHPGSVEITKGSSTFQALGFGQGSLLGCLSANTKNSNWPTVSASFNGNLRSGVKPLNLTIVLLGNSSTTPIEMIRRPVANENTSNPGVLGERYFSQASFRVLLSDNAADITGLPCVSAGAPFNLADLAKPVGSWTSANATALQTLMTTNGTTPLPMAASGAATTAYVAGTGVGTPGSAGPPAVLPKPGGDGYWQANGTAIMTGYIKIDAQTSYGSPCGTYKDVTQEILSLGYAGRNINPVPQSLDGSTLNPAWAGTTDNMQGGASPALPSLPSAQMAGQNNAAALAAGNFTANSTLASPTGTCLDPHPNAVIRLERIRDNPSTVAVTLGALKTSSPTNLPVRSTVAQVCGVDPSTGLPVAGLLPSDFWPNALYDTREGYNREAPPAAPFNTRVTLGGIMNYVELDVKNLAKWLNGTLPAAGSSGPSVKDPNVAPNNFVVYISDRRSNYVAAGVITGAWPPPSPSGHETGEYGYFDNVNSANANGCPDNRVIVVDQSGNIVWQYGQAGVTGSGPNQLNTPVQATFLPSKHILITDQGNERVIEVDQHHIIRWQYGQTGVIGSGPNQLSNPNSAELLENGDILIADENNNRVIEVTRLGNIVWQYAPNDTTLLNFAAFASRLPGGDTLITDSGNSRVIEVDPTGKVVWMYSTLDPSGNATPLPTRAIRLWNGNTLISDQYNDRVIEVDKSGNIVAQFGQLDVIGKTGGLLNAPYDAKLIGDYTGITPPFGAFTRKIDHSPFPF
jgi:Tfp pilus assembly protein PilX